MDIAQLNTNWFPNAGGGAVHVRELSRRLVSSYDCNITVLTKHTTDRPASDVEEFTVKQLPYSGSRIRIINELAYSTGALKHLLGNDYDLVHVHSNTATFPVQPFRLLSDIPVVFTVHGSNLDFSITFTDSVLDRIYSTISRIILKHFAYDHVISVSDELTGRLTEFDHEVTYIPNGVDPDSFPTPGNFDRKKLLFVGRLRPKKNPVDIVVAMEQIVERHPDAELHFVGEGPLNTDLQSEVKSRELTESVTVHGYVSDEDLMRLYKESSIFVLPSEWEGHPLVLLEAWASGIPVLGTNVEGIREFVEEGKTGTLVPLNDPDALALCVIKLFNRPEQVEQMGRNAHDLVRDQYSWADTVARTHDLYEKLIEYKERRTSQTN